MRALPPPPAILTAVSAFQRRALAHFIRRPRTGKIATSVITRVCAEKAAQRNGSVRLYERSSGDDVLRCRHAYPVHRVLAHPRRRKSAATSDSRTFVWTGRALQAGFDDLEMTRLALLHPALAL